MTDQQSLFTPLQTSTLPAYLTVEQVSHLFDTTTVWVQQLADKGVVPRDSHGRYPLACVSAYVTHLRNRAKGRATSEDGETIGHIRHAREVAEKRQAEAKALLLEMEVATAERRLIPAESLIEALEATLPNLKARLQALPASLADKVHKATSAVEAQALMRQSIQTALAELSQLPILLQLPDWEAEAPHQPNLQPLPPVPDEIPPTPDRPGDNPSRTPRTRGRPKKSPPVAGPSSGDDHQPVG